jgi:hypothetical protein
MPESVAARSFSGIGSLSRERFSQQHLLKLTKVGFRDKVNILCSFVSFPSEKLQRFLRESKTCQSLLGDFE